MSRRVPRWCDICRDVDPDLKCTGEDCKKRFHRECLRNTNQSFDDDEPNFICPTCRDNEENDNFCYVCQDEETEQGDSLLVSCDSCPRSCHIGCIGLHAVPKSDQWFCPVCDPQTHKRQKEEAECANKSAVAGLSHKKKGADGAALGNSFSCYVCQMGGKLLGCDSCQQSFHPGCIDQDYLIFDDAATGWLCPICKGEDPLKNMMHKRMTRKARMQLAQEWRACIRREARRVVINVRH